MQRGVGTHLPGQGSPQEVQEHIAQGFNVVSPALLYPQVCIDAGISGCSRQILILTIGYVQVSFGVPELLCQPKVNDVHLSPKYNSVFSK